ncbi:myozenin-1 isoform X1 [Salmo trutta]|uniref:myozenin-1 isoform X1 n=1 Tax=Salmo trutta TaxID=8032 RepID=UPI001131BCEF|nr:myozenin-1-like isoform X1 [Salmo trutta]XP_029620470.1 myozenin-1-like isoform X1 [Salmo trutta]
MPLSTPAPPKRKKANKIITDLTNITQDDEESDPEASEFDLGTKIKTPKDTMLEELSLMTNKGSKMFRRRQQRVERFIVTNENMQNLQSLVPSLGCEMMAPPPEPEPEHVEEEVLDKEAEKEKRRQQYVRTYVSPWERAMRGDESLTATMHHCMAGPHPPHDMPKFKSFNRSALPYGGSEKAGGHMSFEPPEILFAPLELEPLPSLQADIRSRPSFNRTPIGWVCNPEDNSHIHMQLDNMLPFDGETDNL